jgi:mannose-6-phosphate isomerase-like protein (cupin superfamily)
MSSTSPPPSESPVPSASGGSDAGADGPNDAPGEEAAWSGVPDEPVALDEAFARFDAYWAPKIVAELNGQHVKVAKLKGAFDWHHHPDADELFLVVAGRLAIELRERTVHLNAGELFVVPRGVEHRPVVPDGEAHVVLFEPKATCNTGNVETDRTHNDLEWLTEDG